jgi:hypothetical protein
MCSVNWSRERTAAIIRATLEQFTNETSELPGKDLQRKSLPRNRSRRALPAVSERFQALIALKAAACYLPVTIADFRSEKLGKHWFIPTRGNAPHTPPPAIPKSAQLKFGCCQRNTQLKFGVAEYRKIRYPINKVFCIVKSLPWMISQRLYVRGSILF